MNFVGTFIQTISNIEVFQPFKFTYRKLCCFNLNLSSGEFESLCAG